MFKRAARRAVQALLKKGCAENPTAGNVIAALIQWNRSRVASDAPDQTDTDNNITFIIANPATARRINKSRPALSVLVAAIVPASSSCASYPARANTVIMSAAVTSGSALIVARFSVRLTRASLTPAAAVSARSTPAIQAVQ